MFGQGGALQKSAHCCRRPIWAGLFLAKTGRLLQRACLDRAAPCRNRHIAAVGQLGRDYFLQEAVVCCKGHAWASWRLAEIGTLLQSANLGRTISCRNRPSAAKGLFGRGRVPTFIGTLLQTPPVHSRVALLLLSSVYERAPSLAWPCRSLGCASRERARCHPIARIAPQAARPRAFAAAPVPRDRPHAPLPRWPPMPIRLPPLTPALHTFAKSLRATQPGAPIPPWAPLRRRPQPLVHKRAFATSSGESLSRISVPGVASRNR